MARSSSSSRLPALGLTTQQKEEVARLFRERERPYAIAIKLGVPKKLVKDEIRILRASARPGERAPSRALAAVALPLIASSAFLALAVQHRRSAAPRTPESEDAVSVAEYARSRALESDRAVPADQVISSLEDDSELVRLGAIRGYANRPSEFTSPAPLLARLNDGEDRVRFAAIQALGGACDPSVVPALGAVVASERSIAERLLALAALAQIPDDSVLEIYAAAAVDGVSAIRHRAVELAKKRLENLRIEDSLIDSNPQSVRLAILASAKERIK